LVTSAGGIVGQGIMKSLILANPKAESTTSRNYRIIATDKNSKATGIYRADMYAIIPSAASPNFIETILRLCRVHNIDAIFPGSEEELPVLASFSDRIAAESGAMTLASPADVLSNVFDKWRLHEFLKDCGVPSPATSLPENKEQFSKEVGFPLVVKPRVLNGSKRVYVVDDKEEMEYSLRKISRSGGLPILQEFLSEYYEEYTAGVLVDMHGQGTILSSIAMKRELKDGQTYKAFVDDFPQIRQAAESVALKFGVRGPVNIQLRLHEDKPMVFDINPRFSGSCPIRAACGVNEPDLLFRNAVLGERKINHVKASRRLVCMRYWNEVYIPYDVYEKISNSLCDDISKKCDGSFTLDYF
jgi:carbamoyl-phosphate synthase large subunit